MMRPTTNPHSMPSHGNESMVRRPLQSLNVNKHHGSGHLKNSEHLQDKPTKPKATTLGFATAIQAASSSVPEMSVDEDKRDESPSCNEQFDSIFRERMSIWAETREDTPDNTEEVEDSWTLKRASPLANDDDADEECMSYESPAKKTKVQTIFWENHLSIEEPFDIVSMMGSL